MAYSLSAIGPFSDECRLFHTQFSVSLLAKEENAHVTDTHLVMLITCHLQ